MARQIKDPGFGTKYASQTKRLLNQDGSFNVHKVGIGNTIRNTYHSLINMSWGKFLILAITAIFIINVVFALIYVALGVEHLRGDIEGDLVNNIFQAFYFSFQTFTTVGYGHIVPIGVFTNLVAFLESTTGLMVFAIITGLLYGRFSKPSMRLLFSRNALIAPFENGWALMFRVTNLRKSMLIELHANVSISMVVDVKGEKVRRYYRLPLQIDNIEFFPASWTIVHPISETSPLNKFNLGKLDTRDFEIIIQLKGFDDTFSQKVHAHFSYIKDELIVGAKFKPAYTYDEKGNLLLPIDRFHDYELVNYPDMD